MAAVYLGRWTGDADFARVVAVKTLLPELFADERLKTMFRDEVQLVARLRHPNLLPCLDVVEHAGALYMVMDYVHGATLSVLLRHAARRKGHIPLAIALRIMRDALRGLHAAHQARDEQGQPLGLIHRDVSPQNMLVGVDGLVRIIDFGIAKANGRVSTTRAGEVKGKLSYLAPEQLRAEPASQRTDVYAAAVVLWELLAGRKLFDGDTLADVTFDILRAPITAPSRLRVGLTERMDALVLRGLDRDPAARWESAEAMASAIDRLTVVASDEQVGAWVRQLDAERLAELARAVEAIERAPRLPAPPLPPPSAQSLVVTVRPPAARRESRHPPPSQRASSEPRGALLSLASTRRLPSYASHRELSPLDLDEVTVPTRTQLTSHADVTPTPVAEQAPRRRPLTLGLATLTVVGLVAATLWRSPAGGHDLGAVEPPSPSRRDAAAVPSVGPTATVFAPSHPAATEHPPPPEPPAPADSVLSGDPSRRATADPSSTASIEAPSPTPELGAPPGSTPSATTPRSRWPPRRAPPPRPARPKSPGF